VERTRSVPRWERLPSSPPTAAQSKSYFNRVPLRDSREKALLSLEVLHTVPQARIDLGPGMAKRDTKRTFGYAGVLYPQATSEGGRCNSGLNSFEMLYVASQQSECFVVTGLCVLIGILAFIKVQMIGL
jgi:hypothetical protein